MPTVASHRPAEPVSQADLALLNHLTSDSSSLGSASCAGGPHCGHDHPAPTGAKSVQRRDQHMDSLLLSAVLAGSGPVTRHHFGHGGESRGRVLAVHHLVWLNGYQSEGTNIQPDLEPTPPAISLHLPLPRPSRKRSSCAPVKRPGQRDYGWRMRDLSRDHRRPSHRTKVAGCLLLQARPPRPDRSAKCQ